jgi:hypothetical protein
MKRRSSWSSNNHCHYARAEKLHRTVGLSSREQELWTPGSADTDHQEIEEVDQLRLDLINAIYLLTIL